MVNRSSKTKRRQTAVAKHAAAVELGRLGGLKGGKARAARLTSDERRQIARSAAIARWSKDQGTPTIKTTQETVRKGGFDTQKKKFQTIPASVLSAFENQFVVSHNGKILDSDVDLPTLTRRFFKRHPRKSVYITKVGGTPAIIGSPIFER